jgi:predicted hydrocarbon binding protein
MNNTILSELQWSAEAGALTFKDVRYLLIRPEPVIQFQKAVEAEVGFERAGELLYEGGFVGGQLSGRRYKEVFGLSDREAVEFMCRMGAQIGWGRFRLIEMDSKARRLTVEVDRSPFAELYGGGAAGGVCHLIRGVLAGLANGAFAAEVRAVEPRCLARGDACCRFEVVPAA